MNKTPFFEFLSMAPGKSILQGKGAKSGNWKYPDNGLNTVSLARLSG
jgi:hypothetical protein